MEYAPLLGPFGDGELAPAKMLEVESHVAQCEGCRERVLLDEATRHSIRHVTKLAAPEGLRSRINAAMLAEQARTEARVGIAQRDANGFGWRTMVPLATAAAFALAWGAMSRGPIARTTASNTSLAGAGFGDDLLSELVSQHSSPLPSDCTDPNKVGELGQYVGVPVHATTLHEHNARFFGSRILPVRQERAAMLQYEIHDGSATHRVSVFVFDPRRIQVNDADLTPQPVGTAQVRVGHQNGYSVAVTQREGVGYVLASDMDEQKTATLALATSPDF